jgi:hypothetical protein
VWLLCGVDDPSRRAPRDLVIAMMRHAPSARKQASHGPAPCACSSPISEPATSPAREAGRATRRASPPTIAGAGRCACWRPRSAATYERTWAVARVTERPSASTPASLLVRTDARARPGRRRAYESSWPCRRRTAATERRPQSLAEPASMLARYWSGDRPAAPPCAASREGRPRGGAVGRRRLCSWRVAQLIDRRRRNFAFVA